MESRKSHKSKAPLSEERKAKAKTMIAAKSKAELELQTQIHNMAIKIQTRSAKHQKIKESKVSNRVKADRLATHHQRLSRDMVTTQNNITLPSPENSDYSSYTDPSLPSLLPMH
jgi:hypothetical protein